MKPTLHRGYQRGFAIISALFILVVLAMLGAFAASISTTQHIGSAQDIQGARAYQAARAGIEWGLYQRRWTGGYCPGAITTKNMSIASGDIPAAATTLVGISVTVQCTQSGGVYRIVSTACNQPNAAGAACPNTTTLNERYVERQLEVFADSSL